MADPELCQKNDMSQRTDYQWKSEYRGLQAYELVRLKALEDESRKLKKMFTIVSLQNMAQEDVVEKIPEEDTELLGYTNADELVINRS